MTDQNYWAHPMYEGVFGKSTSLRTTTFTEEHLGVDVEKAGAKGPPRGHRAYTRRTKTGKVVQVGERAGQAKQVDAPMAQHIHEMVNANARPLSSEKYGKAGKEAQGEHHLHQQRESIRTNLAKKHAQGKYDHEKSKKAWKYLADSASKHSKAHYGAGGDPATRHKTAEHMADQFKEELDAGEHAHRVPKTKAYGHKKTKKSMIYLGDDLEKAGLLRPDTRSTKPASALPAVRGATKPPGSAPNTSKPKWGPTKTAMSRRAPAKTRVRAKKSMFYLGDDLEKGSKKKAKKGTLYAEQAEQETERI